MLGRTVAHLTKADHHRAVAQALIGSAGSQVSQPPPIDWALVAAFYAAVHYVNAYLWERYHKAPGDHSERTWGVQQDSGINACLTSYDFLKDAGYKARYDETYSLSEQDARILPEEDLREVESTILRILGLPIPTW